MKIVLYMINNVDLVDILIDCNHINLCYQAVVIGKVNLYTDLSLLVVS